MSADVSGQLVPRREDTFSKAFEHWKSILGMTTFVTEMFSGQLIASFHRPASGRAGRAKDGQDVEIVPSELPKSDFAAYRIGPLPLSDSRQ